MKKISTTAAKATRNIGEQKLTIGLDLGDRSSWYCVLDETGEVLLAADAEHDAEGHEGSVRGHAAESDRAGNRDAFALGGSRVSRIRATITILRVSNFEQSSARWGLYPFPPSSGDSQ